MKRDDIYNTVVEYLVNNRERFYRLAFSYTKDSEASLDVVQNAICKALEKYGDIRKIESINSWFYRVLLNETYAYLKKEKREIAFSDDEMPVQVYNEKAYERDDGVYQAIERLPREMREVVVLRFFEDMSLEEISKVTGANLNTVKTRLYSAIKKLKLFYKEAE